MVSEEDNELNEFEEEEENDASFIDTNGVFEEDDIMSIIDGTQIANIPLYTNECWRRLERSRLTSDFLAILQIAGEDGLTLDETVKEVFDSLPGMFKPSEFNTYILNNLFHEFPIVAQAYGYRPVKDKRKLARKAERRAIELLEVTNEMEDVVMFHETFVAGTQEVQGEPTKKYNFNLFGKHKD